jgi:hypothetical protein
MAMSNAERQKAYRERKKAMQSRQPVMELMEGQEHYREELRPQPVLERKVPPPCVVEGHPDDLPPVKIEPETLTYFDVYKRRHDGMFK